MASDDTSLASGDRCSRSSSTPTANIASEASATGAHVTTDVTMSARSPTTRNPALVPIAMAMPPIVGVGAECQRSGRGGTTAPMVGARRRTSAPLARVAATATMNAISSLTERGACTRGCRSRF